MAEPSRFHYSLAAPAAAGAAELRQAIQSGLSWKTRIILWAFICSLKKKFIQSFESFPTFTK